VETDFVRDLTETDLELLGVEKGVVPTEIKKLRDSHHQVARLLATGFKPGQVSIITGYSGSRISILQGSPMFQELLEFYRGESEAGFADLQDRLATLSLDAVEEIRDRLNDGELSNKDLLKLVELTADRTGHGPRTTSVNVAVNLAGRLEKAKERVKQLEIKTIDDDILSEPIPEQAYRAEQTSQRLSSLVADPLSDG
jgi:hypothetical protein